MKNKLINLCFTLILCLLPLVIFAKGQNVKPGHEEPIDDIVATINDDIITKNELNQAVEITKTQMVRGGLNVPTPKVLQSQVLTQLINRKLELQLAKQARINTTIAELDEAIGKIAAENGISTSVLYSKVEEEGTSREAYRNQIREEMTIQKIQRQDVASHIVITPQELETFKRSQAWQMNSDKEYHLEDILISVPDAPSEKDIASAKQQADTVMSKLQNGQPINTVTSAESNNGHALQDGDLGWRRLAEIPSAFALKISSMKENSFAGPIQTSNGFHIIRLTGMRALQSKNTTVAKDQLQDMLFQRKFDEALQGWLSKIRSQAYVQTQLA